MSNTPALPSRGTPPVRTDRKSNTEPIIRPSTPGPQQAQLAARPANTPVLASHATPSADPAPGVSPPLTQRAVASTAHEAETGSVRETKQRTQHDGLRDAVPQVSLPSDVPTFRSVSQKLARAESACSRMVQERDPRRQRVAAQHARHYLGQVESQMNLLAHQVDTSGEFATLNVRYQSVHANFKACLKSSGVEIAGSAETSRASSVAPAGRLLEQSLSPSALDTRLEERAALREIVTHVAGWDPDRMMDWLRKTPIGQKAANFLSASSEDLAKWDSRRYLDGIDAVHQALASGSSRGLAPASFAVSAVPSSKKEADPARKPGKPG